jgi:hypothetical protein
MDLFVTPTIGFYVLYTFIIVRLARRNLVWINVTAHPTADWIARQIREAFPGPALPHPRSGSGLRRCRQEPIARHGHPRQTYRSRRALAERVRRKTVGSIRRECFDHVIALGEAHLRGILQAYARYYNDLRTHRSLDKDAPFSRRFSGPEASRHRRCSADCITNTCERRNRN